MPRKTAKNNEAQVPSQGQIARLIGDSLELFENQLLNSLMESSSDLNLSRENLVEINKHIKTTGANMKEKAINNLLGYYR
tara:strand:- start:393 stop:632 length:240 start_codon:yes stop_codon:yes gene_type:complete